MAWVETAWLPLMWRLSVLKFYLALYWTNIGYDIVDELHFWIPVPELMSVNVKGIASRLRSAVEEITLRLPLNAAKLVQVAMRSTHRIASDDCI